ncbi:MAG: NAD(+) diphosphatase [Bacteroidales bacterium]|nr:NAD(+) diphosphatase [Bacteroidales bacterium]
MALKEPSVIPEGKRTYIFRGREILVDGGGEAAGAEAVASLVPFPGTRLVEDEATGCVGMEFPSAATAPEGFRFIPFPTYFFTHDDDENARVSRMRGYSLWLSSTKFCSACGQPLRLHAVENALECPGCGRLHFPRVEPCIIVLVTRGDELLLLRNIRDTMGIYACLAGFVEIGETLEQAVRREVREETGLTIKNIRYVGSQGWPFPDQLMAGFYADYAGGDIHIQKSEIADARWFRRDALPPLPKPGSIAWRLIHDLSLF